MELRKNTHHIFRIMYHFVWIPKYRRKVFKEPYRNDLKKIIRKIAYDYDMEVEELEIPEDHVHLVIRGQPRMSPSEIMMVIKSISARELFKKHSSLKKKYFWGGKLWTSSYYVETIGKSDESGIKRYVQDQLREMDGQEKAAMQLGLFDGED